MSGLRIAGLLMAIVVVAGACGGDSSSTQAATSDANADPNAEPNAEPDSSGEGTDPYAGDPSIGLLRCVPDAPGFTADPSLYGDEPVYVANEQPTEEVRAWAMTKPGFEEIWIDRDHNGWITIGFSQDASARQAELEAEFPDVGVVAVEVPYTDAELQALRDEVQLALEGLPNWGLSHSVSQGQVEVLVPVLDDETLALLAPLASPMLCVSGLDPDEAVADGPQAPEGDGWRLLGTDRTGQAYRTGVATTPEQYQALWTEAGLGGEPPPVDFETEVVIWFGAVYGSSCPIRLDDVIVDLEGGIVHGLFVNPGNPTVCNDDANPEAYVVAITRSDLPAAPFDVQLDADEPPAGAPEERTTVTVDLRPAGSVAGPGDLVVGSHDDQEQSLTVFRGGETIEDGFVAEFTLDMTCRLDVIGPLNDTWWQTTEEAMIGDDPETREFPAEWVEMTETAGWLLDAEFLLETDPARLIVTIGDRAVEYQPTSGDDEAEMICG